MSTYRSSYPSWQSALVVLVGTAVLLAACATPAPVRPVPPVPVERSGVTPTSQSSVTPITPITPMNAIPLLPEEPAPPGAALEFNTDFSRHTVPYAEIFSGGPPRDGIPAIDRPQFESVAQADTWLQPVEPVILLQIGADARAYPLAILTWHEIVNDTVGGVPVVVTFCPLCNTAIAFERTVQGRVLDFGTTGRLRYSNLVMYDRPTESWWQQATGEAIAGELAGTRLAFQPAAIIGWEEFKEAYPAGQVLSRDTSYSRPYGQNPYAGYDDVNTPPFAYRGPEPPGVLPAVARVLTVDRNGDAVAYPYDVLSQVHVVNDTVGGAPVVILWAAGTASALDAGTVAGGRDVGAASAYARTLDGRLLRFAYDGAQIVDRETGSTWDVLGHAQSGALAGRQLTPVVAINHFWFSWAAFKPQTRVYQP